MAGQWLRDSDVECHSLHFGAVLISKCCRETPKLHLKLRSFGGFEGERGKSYELAQPAFAALRKKLIAAVIAAKLIATSSSYLPRLLLASF